VMAVGAAHRSPPSAGLQGARRYTRAPALRRYVPIDIALGLLAVVLLTLGTGLFVAAEFALVAVDRDRIHLLAEQGSRRARISEGELRRLSFYLSGAQLGITVTSLIVGFIAEPTIAKAIEPALEALPFVPERSALGISIAIALAIATAVQMVIGELVPKGIAIARPERTALFLAVPVQLYSTVFGPLIRFLNAAANWTCRRFGIEPREELTSVRSLDELQLLIRSSGEEGTLDAESMALLTRSIRFGEKTAADALVPRTSLVALREEDTVADLVAAAVDTGHSRFPVHSGDLDDIVGVVHAKDVFRLPPAERGESPVTTIMRDARAVPETRDLESLLLEMRAEAVQLVVVVDEYGGTAGIVTLEDLVEEIVGDIEDEYDPVVPTPPLTARQQAGVHVVEASLHPDELAELTGLEIPEGDYETLAGFLLTRFGRIPDAGDRTEWEGWRFEVLAVDRLRIALVRLIAPPPGQAPSSNGGDR
jgi:CBS domain containing-hemolysin-like protein